MMTVVDLMGSEDLSAGMTSLAAGESVTVGRTTLSCAAGGEDCSLTVMVDDVTGTQRASSTGGMVTVEVAAPPAMPEYADLGLPMGNALTSTSGLDEVDDSEAINIAAGESVVRGGVLFSCPADGDACRVMLQNEAGTAVASYTGGTPTATVAVPTATIALPSGHDLIAGTVTIPAGGTYTVGTTVVSCPAGGMACTVTVSQAPLGGPIVGSSSGGTATVALAPSPSWTGTRAGTVDGAINPTTVPTAVVTTDASGADSATQADLSEIRVNAQGTSRIVAGTRTPPQRFGAPAGAAPSIGAGWNGLVFERSQAMGATQRVVVYNDRTVPAAGRAFSASFSGTGFNSDPRMVDSTDLGLGTRYGATFASLSMSASFPAAPPPGQLASASYISGRAFPGAFAGVAGMFSCAETTTGSCVARNDTVTGLVLNGGTWTFTATDANDVATVSDGNYVTMGWWMNEPLAANGAYTFGTFQTATNPTDGAVGDMTSGNASYAGAATGLYSSRARTGDTMRAGAFNADASLTANFDNNMLSGSIANFRDQNGAAISGWVVSLDQAAMTDGQGPNNNATGLSSPGTTSGAGAGGLGWSGNWNAWMVGGRSAGAASHPNAVVGSFDARVGMAVPTTGAYSSVSGVFGAN
jgi:hypothetical protein